MKSAPALSQAPITDIKKGYATANGICTCLFCGHTTEKGIVYQQDGVFYEAEKQMTRHIQNEHGAVFSGLLKLDKSRTGLSDHQRNLLLLFYQGKSDAQIQDLLGIGSLSTIRNHRFLLKEKERQARLFLSMMELLAEKEAAASERQEPDGTEDTNAALGKYFPDGIEGRLNTIRIRSKHRPAVLAELARRFAPGRLYTEKEVNVILGAAHEDFATLRRWLIDYNLMTRKPNGSDYTLAEATETQREEHMDRRKEIILQYKQTKTEAGVYQIKNTANGKALVLAAINLTSRNGKLFELKIGSSHFKKLQEDWNKFGEKAFVVEVLEVLKENEEPGFDKREELKKLETRWLNKLQPFGDKGYNE